MTEFADDLETPTEADLDQCYGSKYLGAADLGNKKIRTRIAKVRKETMQQQGGKPERPKFVVYFTTLDKAVVLNATNKTILVTEIGKDPARWVGAEVGLYTVDTAFGGKPVKGLRLKVLSAPKAAAPTPLKPAAAEEAPPWDAEDPGYSGEFSEAAE